MNNGGVSETEMMASRREVLTSLSFLFLPVETSAAPSSLLLLGPDEPQRMREFSKGSRSAILHHLADSALRAGPWSVVDHRPGGVDAGAGPHDYLSEGPYWWPNPRDPNGPYIRKDGRRNPGRFTANANDLHAMCEALLALGLGAYMLGRQECARHASRILSIWFVEPESRMNPNLEYGQAIRGITSGRGTGIIDTVPLIHAAQGIALLEAAAALDASLLYSVRHWFGDYLEWLNNSSKGRAEKASRNNHATWWTAQAAVYAVFTGNTVMQRMAWDYYRDYLVPTQIQPDGRCPREEARTKSLSYSSMNLDAFAVICRAAQMNGVDLWRFETARGIGLQTAFNYLMPYVLRPNTWRHAQIESYSAGSVVFPALAGVSMPSRALLSAYDQLPRANTAWIQFVDLLRRVEREKLFGPAAISSR